MDGSVVVRDVAAGSQAGRFEADDGSSIYAVAWSKDGSRLATGSSSGAARMWSADDWAPIGPELRAHGNYVLEERFTDDGAWLATYGGDGSAVLWDVATGRQLGSPLISTPNEFGGMWLAPDGTKLITYQTDGSVWSWPLDDATWLTDVCSIAGRDLTSDEWQTYAPGVPPTPICAGPAD
jgi:WD40 repeat protein